MPSSFSLSRRYSNSSIWSTPHAPYPTFFPPQSPSPFNLSETSLLDLNIDATFGMCIWCFESICFALNRYDLLQHLSVRPTNRTADFVDIETGTKLQSGTNKGADANVGSYGDNSASRVKRIFNNYAKTQRKSLLPLNRPKPCRPPSSFPLLVSPSARFSSSSSSPMVCLPFSASHHPPPKDSPSRTRTTARQMKMYNQNTEEHLSVLTHSPSGQQGSNSKRQGKGHRGGPCDRRFKTKSFGFDSPRRRSLTRTYSTVYSSCSPSRLDGSIPMAPSSPAYPSPPPEIQVYTDRCIRVPLFVTWMMTSQNSQWSPLSNYEAPTVTLRGCIGSLSPVPIGDLDRFAHKAAFHDSRFNPITSTEIDHLECHVSILKSFEHSASPFDWDIDVHGLIINFTHPTNGIHREYHATFLPGVAKKHNMDQRRTLEELIRKSGYRGLIDPSLINTLRVTRYQASVYQLAFKEFQSYRRLKKPDGTNAG